MKQKVTKKGYKKENRGITLIALVVTIVILLILAGVSITAGLGNNGLIDEAKKAEQKTNEIIKNTMSTIDGYKQELEDIMYGSKEVRDNQDKIKKIKDGIIELQEVENGLGEMQNYILYLNEKTMQIANTEDQNTVNNIIIEIKSILDDIDNFINEKEYNNVKLLNCTYSKIYYNVFELNIQNMSSRELGIRTDTLETDLQTEEGPNQYIDKLNNAYNIIYLSRSKTSAIIEALSYIESFYEEENNIINSNSDNVENKVAINSLTHIKNALETCKYNVTMVANDGTMNEGDIYSLKIQLIGLVKTIDIIAEETDYNNKKLLDGTFNNIIQINTTTLGESTKLRTDLSTETAESIVQQYQRAIQIVEEQISKLQ